MFLTPIILVLASISLELGLSVPADVHIHLDLNELDEKDFHNGMSLEKLIYDNPGTRVGQGGIPKISFLGIPEVGEKQ